MYINVTGGLYLNEPAADLAICLALVSGILDRILPDDFLAVGEIGLSGECRSVPVTEQRINEAKRLGFNKIMVPKRAVDPAKNDESIIGVGRLFDAIKTKGIFKKKEENTDINS